MTPTAIEELRERLDMLEGMSRDNLAKAPEKDEPYWRGKVHAYGLARDIADEIMRKQFPQPEKASVR